MVLTTRQCQVTISKGFVFKGARDDEFMEHYWEYEVINTIHPDNQVQVATESAGQEDEALGARILGLAMQVAEHNQKVLRMLLLGKGLGTHTAKLKFLQEK